MRSLDSSRCFRGVDLVIRVTIAGARTVEEAKATILSGERYVVEAEDAKVTGVPFRTGYGTME